MSEPRLRIEIPPAARGCRPGHEVGLLADAVAMKPGQRIAELGCGVGALALTLAARAAVEVVGFEIQTLLVEAARRNARLNADRLKAEVRFEEADVRRLGGTSWEGRFDHVVANPPFYRAGQGRRSPRAERDLARHEGETTLEDFVCAAVVLLRARGRFHCIVPPGRLEEFLSLAGRYRCPVKTVRPVYTRRGGNAEWVVLTGIKGAKQGLVIPAPRDLWAEPG